MADPIPSTLTAGEGIDLVVPVANHPTTDGWVVRWVIRGASTTRVSVDATPDTGDTYRLTLPAAESAKLRGPCDWQLWASKGAVSHIVGSGQIVVAPSLTDITPAERILAALEAALERLAADDEAEVEIEGRRLVFKDPLKVERMIAVYRAKIRVERGGSAFTLTPVRLR